MCDDVAPKTAAFRFDLAKNVISDDGEIKEVPMVPFGTSAHDESPTKNEGNTRYSKRSQSDYSINDLGNWVNSTPKLYLS